jgi:excinuclease UvrABC nuclease subunit
MLATHLDALRAQARALPEVPGVYFWRDGRNRTLYIGKAVNLRARVLSYFSNARRDRRTRDLLACARSVTYEVAATELDALFRESTLIKRELPTFNRADRLPRSYYYFKFDSSVEEPYMEITRRVEDDGSVYFGPFRTAAVARETMEYLQAVLPLRKCTAMKPRCRPCIYYQMKKCAAPFLSERHHQAHQDAIASLYLLLDGRGDRVAAWLEEKRDRLSDLQLFERAAEVQTRLESLRALLRKQTILDAAIQCRCVLVHQQATEHSDARLLLVAHGSVISYRALGGADAPAVVAWVKAHDPVIRAAERREGELDAATVLERWLTVNRSRVRWIAIPRDVPEEDLRERVEYALRSPRPASVEARALE